jgi:hypothetical protein
LRLSAKNPRSWTVLGVFREADRVRAEPFAKLNNFLHEKGKSGCGA